MGDVQETLHNIERNSAGEYKIIRSKSEIYNSEDGLYYRIYIPAPLAEMDEGQCIIDGLNSSLNRIYKEIGILQGLSFYENNLKGRNQQFYKQEIISVLENSGVEVHIADIFSIHRSDEINERMNLYDCIEARGKNVFQEILSGNVTVDHKDVTFRQNQLWEDEKNKKVSLLDYNPPAPEQIPRLMKDLDDYCKERKETDHMIQICLAAYQFFTIIPYEDNNAIWTSILLNCLMKEYSIGTDYYIPFARYFLEQDAECKMIMRQVRETGNYHLWISFFINIIERALARTNQTIMKLELVRKTTLDTIEHEKQKSLLTEVSAFMEENPIFVISDIEKMFHTAYNTAAKSVIILEKHELVKELSKKQRYRIYCYDKYLREIL